MLVDQQNQPRDKNNPCNRLGKFILFYLILFNDISKIHNYFLLNYSDLPDKRAAILINFWKSFSFTLSSLGANKRGVGTFVFHLCR